MRLLQVNTLGSVDFHRQRAVAKKLRVQLSLARGNGIAGLAQPYGSYRRKFHLSFLHAFVLGSAAALSMQEERNQNSMLSPHSSANTVREAGKRPEYALSGPFN